MTTKQKNEKTQEEKDRTFNQLKDYLTQHKTIFTLCRHISNSGMLRVISVYVCEKDEFICLDYWIKELGIDKCHKTKDGLVVKGCGMDMGFDLIDRTMSKVFGHQYNWQKDYQHRWL